MAEININTDEDIIQTQENENKEDKYEIVTRGNKTYKIFNNGIEKLIYSKEKACSIVYLDTYEGQQIDKIYLPHDFDFDSYEASLIFKYKNIEKGLKWNLLWHIEKIFELSGKNLKK